MTAQVIGQCASHGLDVEGVAIPTRTASGLGWRGPSLIGLAAQHVEVVLRALTGRSWYLTAQLVGQCASLRLQVEGVMASRRAVAGMPWRRPALVAQSAQRIRAVLRSLARGSSIRMTIGSLPCGLLTLPMKDASVSTAREVPCRTSPYDDGALEESARRGHIAVRRQKEVHRLAESVNGAVQILPLPARVMSSAECEAGSSFNCRLAGLLRQNPKRLHAVNPSICHALNRGPL